MNFNESITSASQIEIYSSDKEVTLKQYALEDAEEIFAIIDNSREHLSQHYEDTAEKYPDLSTLINSINYPTNIHRLRFAIKSLQGEIVGAINITPDTKNPQEGEIGYWLGARFTGRGYIGRAVEALTEFGFEQLKYQTIYGLVYETNAPSIKVLQRAGYIDQGKNKDGYIKLAKSNPSHRYF